MFNNYILIDGCSRGENGWMHIWYQPGSLSRGAFHERREAAADEWQYRSQVLLQIRGVQVTGSRSVVSVYGR